MTRPFHSSKAPKVTTIMEASPAFAYLYKLVILKVLNRGVFSELAIARMAMIESKEGLLGFTAKL
jgi:hypothetical protein